MSAKKPVIKVKNMFLGNGMPKICVPITDNNAHDIVATAKESLKWDCEAIEWRVDAYEDFRDLNKTAALLEKVAAVYDADPDKILIFTCRTASDGGVEIDRDDYFKLNELAIGAADLIDIEMNAGADSVRAFIDKAHAGASQVIVSYHDFEKTPSKDELIERMRAAQDAGADVIKAAVMPQTEEDVDTLMSATSEMKKNYAEKPLITMSMGALGRKSRIEGQIFGASLTFGAVKAASAPGQVELSELRKLLVEVDRKVNSKHKE